MHATEKKARASLAAAVSTGHPQGKCRKAQRCPRAQTPPGSLNQQPASMPLLGAAQRQRHPFVTQADAQGRENELNRTGPEELRSERGTGQCPPAAWALGYKAVVGSALHTSSLPCANGSGDRRIHDLMLAVYPHGHRAFVHMPVRDATPCGVVTCGRARILHGRYASRHRGGY